MKNYKLALVGATGLVGRTAINALEEYLLEYSLSTSEKEQEELKELIKNVPSKLEEDIEL